MSQGKSAFAKMYLWLISIALAASCSAGLLAAADDDNKAGLASETHEEIIEAWRAARHQRLSEPDGWLTLVGLVWLEQGEISIGSAADNDIHLSRGPDYWGKVLLDGKNLTFENLDPEHVLIDGEQLENARLIADTEGDATVVSSEGYRMHAIFRESYALRIKDAQAPALRHFRGVDNYPINESWRIEGAFTPAGDGESIEIANVLGQISDTPIFGELKFEKDGKTHTLMGLEYEGTDKVWFIFADRTSGRGTYGAGRYVYSDAAPADGRLTVDFNKAYNPPCVFNPWSTCPIPPHENRMDLHVTAGEKDFHPHTE